MGSVLLMPSSTYQFPFESYFHKELDFKILSDGPTYEYVKSIVEPTHETQIVFSDSKAGTGKTSLAMAAAYYRIQMGLSSKIIYVRNTLAVRENGFLPGTADEKEFQFMAPAKESIDDIGYRLGDQKLFQTMMTHDEIEVVSTSYLRGRDLSGDIVLILDEAQNLDTTEIQTVLTRLHDDAKVVVIGSSKQCDNNKLRRFGREKITPFQLYIKHFERQSKIATEVVNLTKNYRGELANYADEIGTTIDLIKERDS